MKETIATERTICVGDRKIELVCPICGGKKFYQRLTLMNTAAMTFFDLDWANPEATNFVCEDCSYIFWFMEDLTVKEKEVPLTPVQQYEVNFKDYSDKKLYKVLYGKGYNEDAKAAARNLLRQKNLPV